MSAVDNALEKLRLCAQASEIALRAANSLADVTALEHGIAAPFSAIGPSTRDLVLSLDRGSANKGEDDSRGLHGGRGKIDEESQVGKSFEVQTAKEIKFQLQVTKR